MNPRATKLWLNSNVMITLKISLLMFQISNLNRLHEICHFPIPCLKTNFFLLLPMLAIRPYQPADKARLIELFLLNTPAYFHPNEQQDLDEYLDTEIENYFVAEVDGNVIACGGSNIEDEAGWLSWYIVHPDYHGKGAGRLLVERNLEILVADARVKKLIVRTSQLVYQFYTKFGYELIFTEDNYWGEGFHLYHMEKAR